MKVRRSRIILAGKWSRATRREIPGHFRGQPMSVVRGFGLNGKSYYTNVCKPMSVWCNFIVDHTNGNGLGIRSLKSNGFVESVFMNTNQTPGNINNFTNPNPAVGYALIRFKNCFNYYLGGFSGQIIPLTSTSTTSVTTGSVYVITSVGTTTLAQWLAAGVLAGTNPASLGGTTPAVQTPAVGQAFVAIKTGALGGTGTVGLPGVPTSQVVSVVGDPNQSISNVNVASNAGAQIIVQFAAATNASTTTLVAAAPSDGTVVGMFFEFDGSSVTIDGI